MTKAYDTDDVVTNADGGKQSATLTRLELVPARAIREVGLVLAKGAEKYGTNNHLLINTDDHLAHALQHIYAFKESGELEDLSHAATRLLFALEQEVGGSVRRHPVYTDYAVSTLGDVYSMKRGSLTKLKGSINAFGYRNFDLKQSGLPRYQAKGSWLVIETFIGDRGEFYVCHNNNVKTDDRLENLRLCTPEENAYDVRVNGRTQSKFDVLRSRLSNDDIKDIFRLMDAGVNQTTIASLFDESQPNISELKHNRDFFEDLDLGVDEF